VEAGGRRVSSALELAWSTPPAWAEAALAEPLALLSDHAHCELGAASAAQGLLVRRPEQAELVERLSAHALDELRHFKRVHRLLVELGGALAPVRRSPYAEGLLARAERGPSHLLERLLIAGLIELRSLERFQLLARHARTRAGGRPGLAELYEELAPSEEGHARLFLELARDAFGAAAVAERWPRWLAREAELVQGLAFGPRIHSGPPAGPPAGPGRNDAPALQGERDPVEKELHA